MKWSLAAVSATLVVVLAHVQSRSIELTETVNDSADGSGPLWEPSDGRSRDEWIKYHGQSEEEMKRVKLKLAQFKMNEMFATPGLDISSVNYSALIEEDVDDCMWLTEEQVDEMLEDQTIEHMKELPTASPEHHRQKRNLANFEKRMYEKWTSMPIRYKFDGTHREADMTTVRNAFAHWAAQTCVVFQEIPMDEELTDHHVLVTREGRGCNSYVGQVYLRPQPVTLAGGCLYQFGVPVHEIGHLLGLLHEQQRLDRDDYIKINWENLGSDTYLAQFSKHMNSVDLGLPYDFNSAMHYSPKTGSNNSMYTIESLDPEYQHNMGQRTGISYLDAKIINTVYCSTKCSGNALRRPCEREGYQNPKDCSRCICPDGFSGRYCDELQPAHGAQCGGELYATTSPQTIKTPGFDSPGYYDNFIQCNWHIKAPRGHDIVFKFEEDNFRLYCALHNRCYHWAELRYKGNLGLEGPRFCCKPAPNTTFKGELGEMMLVFKSNYSVYSTNSRRGFKASFYAEARGSVGDQKTTTTTKPTTTTTKLPTTTTKRTTTTTMATTTKSTDDGQEHFKWSCSFETGSNRQTWCGITQNTDDDFNWTIQKGRTPSSKTGPSSAFDGQYYVFIEASNPRRKNDNAVLTLPELDVEGTHCISFNYHMYGFHINTLQLLKKSREGTTVLWQKSNQQGDRWLHMAKEIELNERDQLAFKGIRGGEYSGDIGLDMIYIHSGGCVSPADDVVPSSDEFTTSSPGGTGGAGDLATWLGAYVITFALVLKNLML